MFAIKHHCPFLSNIFIIIPVNVGCTVGIKSLVEKAIQLKLCSLSRNNSANLSNQSLFKEKGKIPANEEAYFGFQSICRLGILVHTFTYFKFLEILVLSPYTYILHTYVYVTFFVALGGIIRISRKSFAPQ